MKMALEWGNLSHCERKKVGAIIVKNKMIISWRSTKKKIKLLYIYLVSSIPLAKLRLQEKAKKFALVNLLNVGVNILLNLFFLIYCKEAYESGHQNLFVLKKYFQEKAQILFRVVSFFHDTKKY
ncbi:hypothetical protein N9K77_00655 [bacterium]|nr:hypothetical protein [bacterium]